MNALRSLVAIIAGLAVISIVTELLEFTLVNAAAGGRVNDLAAYFEVRNQPRILAAKLAYTAFAALLGGYVTGRIAGYRETRHGQVAAAVQTAALVYGFTWGELAALTPVWVRIGVIVLTGPAMIAGAAVRERVRGVQSSHLSHP